MVTGIQFAGQACSDKYTGIKYDDLDCQAFVELVLRDCGVRKPDGSVYNWRGSNSMWRNVPGWRGTLDECRTEYGSIPLGAWLFIVKYDGGEKDKGYNDDKGNAKHVAIYCRNTDEPVRDSTRSSSRNGVGYRTLKSFTHVLLPSFLLYRDVPTEPDQLSDLAHILRDPNSSDAEWIKALTKIVQTMKGV